MSTQDDSYTLYYWPIPFRGQFIRAILTYADADWKDADDVVGMMNEEVTKQPVPFLGPPLLVVDDTGFALSQMSAIVFYLGEQFGLLPEDAEGRAHTIKIVNDANDVIDELTLQGGMQMWTDETWREYRPRLIRWMHIWEEQARRADVTVSAGYLFETAQPTVADIVSATLWMTLAERFPSIGALLEKQAPLTAGLVRRIWEMPIFQRFSKDTFARYGDAYCGGNIEKSLREVIGHE